MPKRYPEDQLSFARKLRREDTRAEELLWNSLRKSQLEGLKFRRQVPIGPYIVDFLCIAHRLIVELDGVVHLRPEQVLHDTKRDQWLRSQGYTVLRISNDLVISGGNIPLEQIRQAVAGLSFSR